MLLVEEEELLWPVVADGVWRLDEDETVCLELEEDSFVWEEVLLELEDDELCLVEDEVVCLEVEVVCLEEDDDDEVVRRDCADKSAEKAMSAAIRAASAGLYAFIIIVF